MTTTAQDARALTYLARRLRVDTWGARQWDEAGTYAVIAKLIGQNLASVTERVIRHACDPEARTPAAIERPFTPPMPGPQPARPPKVSEDPCDRCGQRRLQCQCPEGPTRRRAGGWTPEQGTAYKTAARRAIAEATASNCSHGVPRTHCTEHRDQPAPRDVRAIAKALIHPLTRPTRTDDPVGDYLNHDRPTEVDLDRVHAAMHRFRPGQTLTWEDA